MSESTLFQMEPLPSERCPGCGRSKTAVLWLQDLTSGIRSEYRCTGCGAKWSVDGRQEELAFDFAREDLTLSGEGAA